MRIFFSLFLLLSISILAGCKTDKKEFAIEGTILNAGNIQTVVLYEGDRKLDSAFLTENGKFRLQRSASQPRLFRLVAGKHFFPVILQNGDLLRFKADLQDEEGDYEVSGSELSGKIREFAVIQREKARFEEQMDQDFIALSSRLDHQAVLGLREEFILRYRAYMQDYKEKTLNFAQDNEDLAGFYAMTTLDREFAEAELIAYSEKIEGRFEENAVVRQFLQDIEMFKRLAVGQPAPVFESLTANNRTVSLTDFQGQYTLLDFWASWCIPCREENPNIVRQYHLYKDKGFTVFGVSLDGNPGSWLKAIEDDKLDWTHVSDLQAWNSGVVELYDIKAIPTSYLLDPAGIIIAKNLRGAELENFLKEIFDK